MRVSDSPAFLEGVANHPRVFPHVRSPIDPFQFGAAWLECLAVEWDTGGVVFHRRGDEWQAHLLFLPRTPDVLDKCREALAYAYGNGAEVVTGEIPEHLKHACRVAGALLHHEHTTDGLAHYRLTRADWHKERP